MGNNVDTGFNVPPPVYLSEIRKKKDRYFRERAISGKRVESISVERKPRENDKLAELNSESVKKYIISNPAFLDDLMVVHISTDRIRGWLKSSKEKDSEGQKQKEDSEFTEELMERSFRHRQILLINRSRLLYPKNPRRNELNDLIDRPFTEEYESEVESHLFPYTEIPEQDINKVFIYMSRKLLGKHAFPTPQLYYFLSTLKSNYYDNEYHNYNHAISHAQSMYWILRRNPGVFNELEMKCLLISSLAHDVGHAGVNDAYIKNVGNGLEKLYNSPILENHHFQTCLLILQDINCNVFCDLEGDDYRQVMDEIQHNIISTSLKRYKPQSENMLHIIATNLDYSRLEVKDAAKSVLMMCCDLCAAWKSWTEHKSTVWSVYKEFFSQGEKEMSFQIDCAEQMMRKNSDKIPEYQVSFLNNMILPIFNIVAKMFPSVSCIVEATEENLELWKTYL